MPATLTPAMRLEQAQERIADILTDFEQGTGETVLEVETWHEPDGVVGAMIHVKQRNDSQPR